MCLLGGQAEKIGDEGLRQSYSYICYFSFSELVLIFVFQSWLMALPFIQSSKSEKRKSLQSTLLLFLHSIDYQIEAIFCLKYFTHYFSPKHSNGSSSQHLFNIVLSGLTESPDSGFTLIPKYFLSYKINWSSFYLLEAIRWIPMTYQVQVKIFEEIGIQEEEL